jgi:hypothetical protein
MTDTKSFDVFFFINGARVKICTYFFVQVYEDKNWSLAEDHIHFTIGRQAANLKQISEAARAFARLLTPVSRQSAAQQAAFLREFLTTQQVFWCGFCRQD